MTVTASGSAGIAAAATASGSGSSLDFKLNLKFSGSASAFGVPAALALALAGAASAAGPGATGSAGKLRVRLPVPFEKPRSGFLVLRSKSPTQSQLAPGYIRVDKALAMCRERNCLRANLNAQGCLVAWRPSTSSSTLCQPECRDCQWTLNLKSSLSEVKSRDFAMEKDRRIHEHRPTRYLATTSDHCITPQTHHQIRMQRVDAETRRQRAPQPER